MALLSVTNKIAYHLFDCTSFEIIQYAKWQPHNTCTRLFNNNYSNFFLLIDLINSLDFDPEGQRIATLDYDGVLSVSDVNADDVLFYRKLMSGGHSS